MDSYSTIVLLCAAFVLIAVLFLVRRYNRKHQEKLVAQDGEHHDLKEIELIRVQNPTDKDLKAYTLIEEERQKIWKNLAIDTSIAPRKIYQLSFDLIRNIAAIYHPEAENPVFQASAFDLLELNYRIIERVKEHLEELPDWIRDLNVSDILRYKDYYDKLNEFQFVKLAKDHKYLYNIGKYVWMGYNALNPWYWSRRVVFTAGKEGAFRYLLTTIITVVGEEAVLVYSRRNIRAKTVAIEKSIVFEMINMAVSDGDISQKEYEILLDFILNNPRLDNQMKVTLLKAVGHKRSTRSTLSPDMYDAKEKRRLLDAVERVAKADNLGLLKKREALKALEESLSVTSEYRTRLELTPHEEIESRDVMHKNRRREEALLRLLVQAGSIGEEFPDSLRDYIVQRASIYPLPFSEAEQEGIFSETTIPTPQDTLTDVIQAKGDRERALTEILDALLWYFPFSREKEAFYTLIVTAFDMKKAGEAILHKVLRQKLPSGKLIEKPPTDVMKVLYRLLQQEEQVVALQNTATKYRFTTGGASAKQKDAECWLCATDQRVLVLAATTIDKTLYHHDVVFGQNLRVQVTPGKLYDVYVLQDDENTVRLENALFRSSKLKQALHPYIQTGQSAIEHS